MKKFDETAIFNQKNQVYFLPDENYIQNSEKYKIGIFGGGITGLASAYYARKMFPFATIILFEKEKELGGWMKTVTKNRDYLITESKIYFNFMS